MNGQLSKAIGDAFERAVGEKYEAAGFRVEYRGLMRGKGDRGIDLVATRGKRQMLVQCKAWSGEEELPALVVEKLAEDAQAYIQRRKADEQLLLPGAELPDYGMAIITTTKLSERARRCAQRLGVQYREHWPTPWREPHAKAVEFATASAPTHGLIAAFKNAKRRGWLSRLFG